MSDLTTYTKTTAYGTDKLTIVEPRERYQRQTNLPANWQRARITLGLSWTDTTGPNNTPIADTRATGLGYLGEFAIGLSNGVGLLGEAGNRFVGVSILNTTQLFLALSTGTWRLASSAAGTAAATWAARIGDGATLTSTAVSPSGTPLANTDPTATTAFAFTLTADLTVSTAGSLSASMNIGPSQSDVRDPAMNLASLAVTGASVAATGGWWSAAGSPTPVGCQYLMIRCPLSQNRLRIHWSQVDQLP